MSSTNKTIYYDLPQFVDNDIFNPLVDDNDAYSKIDTALHNIANAEADDASEIVGIKSRLDSAEGDIDALEAQNGDDVLTTTAQTLSGAINEVNAEADALAGKVTNVEDDINNASTGLKVKVTALETQNGNTPLNTTAQTLSGAVNELDGDVGNINTAISGINGKIGNGTIDTVAQTLIGGINELKAKSATKPKYIFIGDSYSIGTNAGEQYGWIAQCKTYLGLTEGTDVFSYGVGGYGFTGNVGTFLSLLNQAISDITDKDSITNIFVAGGFNDIGDSGVSDAIRTFCTTAKTNFKNAKIKIAFIGAFCNKRISTTINPQTFLSTKFEYQSADGKYDIDTDVYGCLLEKDSYIGSDGIHPSVEGYNYLGRFVAQSILGTYHPSIATIQNFTFTPISDLTEASGMNHYWRRTANSVIVWFAQLYLTGSITSTANTNSDLIIGNINNLPLETVSGSSFIAGAPIALRLSTSDGVQHIANGMMGIHNNGDVTIIAPIFKSDGSRYNWNEVTLIENVSKYCVFPIDAICV